MIQQQKNNPGIHRIVRRESARLTASLVSFLGEHHLTLAEDVSQDAMIKALTTWEQDSIPEHPGAWLRKVAKNRAIDLLRHRARESNLEQVEEASSEQLEAEFHDLEDPELRLLYLCCHSSLTVEDQVVLSLNLAAGFRARDIAKLLLKPSPTVAQRLVRLKKKLRSTDDLTHIPPSGVSGRTDVVLRSLYLTFCAGYLPASGDQLVREDIVWESLRLAELVAQSKDGDAASSALCALFCLQASRLAARENKGRLVPLQDQDRSLWNQELIDRAKGYLRASMQADDLSRYHIEAAIAIEHAVADRPESTNWRRIATLYKQLESLTSSPIVTVSLALATLYEGDAECALAKLKAIQGHTAMHQYAPYYAALAEVYRAIGHDEEAHVAQAKATELQENVALKAFLDQRYAALH